VGPFLVWNGTLLVTKIRRTMAIVDIDSTLKHHGETMAVQDILKSLPGVQLSAFHILEDDLKQAFTPENGMVVQEGILLLAREFRTRVLQGDHDELHLVWTQRMVTAVQWNRKEFRIWHWPAQLRPAVLRCARIALQKYFSALELHRTAAVAQEPSPYTAPALEGRQVRPGRGPGPRPGRGMLRFR
jgi:hypothetical protein